MQVLLGPGPGDESEIVPAPDSSARVELHGSSIAPFLPIGGVRSNSVLGVFMNITVQHETNTKTNEKRLRVFGDRALLDTLYGPSSEDINEKFKEKYPDILHDEVLATEIPYPFVTCGIHEGLQMSYIVCMHVADLGAPLETFEQANDKEIGIALCAQCTEHLPHPDSPLVTLMCEGHFNELAATKKN